MQFKLPPRIETYSQDKRLPLEEMYAAYEQLINLHQWVGQIIHDQDDLPILVLTTPQRGPALWILTGIHGEEPAGPNAIVKTIELIASLGMKTPIVLFPLLNPQGYAKNWRYPNEPRDWTKARSVSDSEYLLLNEEGNAPRAQNPAGKEALSICNKVLELIPNFPPLLSIDHHEDEALAESYVYSQGKLGDKDPVAQKVIEILKSAGVAIQKKGLTRFGERVRDGVVGKASDGSIDELLAAEKIFKDGKIVNKLAAHTAVVIETPVIQVSLDKRIATHAKVIESYEELLLLRKDKQFKVGPLYF